MNTFLGFDVGGTKTAWGVFTREGNLIDQGRFETPQEPVVFIKKLSEIIEAQKPLSVGVGIAGTIKHDHSGTELCTNIPLLSDLPIVELLQKNHNIPITVDNDARCAMIGEVWKGSAQNLENAALVTIGTGIGGAYMQHGMVQPHPHDVGEEVSRLIVDQTDVFPARSGQGTVEAFLGGRNLEERLMISMHELSEQVRKNDEEAKEIWHVISYYFIQCIKEIQTHYGCNTIIIGGVGAKDLDYYLQDPAPCRIIAAELGEEAALYGAARLAIDIYVNRQVE